MSRLAQAAGTAWSGVTWPVRQLAASALFASLALLVSLQEIDRLLKATHLPGAPSYGVGSLTPLFHPKLDTDYAANVVHTWTDAAPPPGSSFRGPFDVAAIFLVVDVLFVAAYASLFAVLLVRTRRGLEAIESDDPLVGVYRRLVSFAFAGVFFLAFFDLAEDVFQALLIGNCRPGVPVTPDWCLRGGFGGWFLAFAAWSFTLLKWLFALGVVVPLLLGAVEIARNAAQRDVRATERARRIWRAVLLFRIQIVLVAFFGIVLFVEPGADQTADVIRRWSPHVDFSDAFAGVALTLVLSLVLGATSWLLLQLQAPAGTAADGNRTLWGFGVAGVVCATLGGVGWATKDIGMGVVALGVVLLVVFALSYPVKDVPPSASGAADEGPDATVVRPLLVAAPLVLLGLAMLGAAVPEVVYARHDGYLFLVGAGLLVQAGGWALYALVSFRWALFPELARLSHLSLPAAAWLVVGVGGLLPAALVALGLVVLNPFATADHLGTIGVFAVWLAGVAALGYLALLGEAQLTPPPFFRAFRLSRTPIVLLVLAWSLLALILDKGGYHDIRTVGVGERTKRVVLFSGQGRGTVSAWTRWRNAQPQLERRKPAGDGKVAVPLVLVAAEGGGIRAAYWTAQVLTCAFDGGSLCGRADKDAGRLTRLGDRRAVFAASGASGGSLGLVSYYTHVLEGDRRQDWVDHRLGDDYLAPTWARTLFVDVPNGLLRLNVGQDRAAILERAWEQSWTRRDRSLLRLGWHQRSSGPLAARTLFRSYLEPRSRLPLLLLSGTSVDDGCRVNNSVLNGDVNGVESRVLRVRDCLATGPFEQGGAVPPQPTGWIFGATHDLDDLLCPKLDVRFSTAALLSARFPYVSPSGRVHFCGDAHQGISVVDGGYFDNSSASPLVELTARLEPAVAAFNRGNDGACVVPVYLQIDNHYKGPSAAHANRLVPQLLVPPTTVLRTRDARENEGRQAAAIVFSQSRRFGATLPTPDGERRFVSRYAHVYPRAHPGTEAPLGWVLSDASMRDLTTQLDESGNREELAKVRDWLSPSLRCA